MPEEPQVPEHKKIVGMSVAEAKAWLEKRGFMVAVFDCDGGPVYLTADLVLNRRRLFQRDGIVERITM